MKNLLGIATLATLLPLCANALEMPDLNEARPNQYSYNYAEIQYVDMDNGLDGFRLSGSYDIKPNLAITASLLKASVGRFDYDLMAIGAAYHARWVEFEKSDLIIHASLVNADTSGSDNDLGLTFGAKVRASVKEQLEINGDLSYTTVLDGDLSLDIGAAYTFAPNLAATLNYQLTDNDALSIGLRYYFP